MRYLNNITGITGITLIYIYHSSVLWIGWVRTKRITDTEFYSIINLKPNFCLKATSIYCYDNGTDWVRKRLNECIHLSFEFVLCLCANYVISHITFYLSMVPQRYKDDAQLSA